MQKAFSHTFKTSKQGEKESYEKPEHKLPSSSWLKENKQRNEEASSTSRSETAHCDHPGCDAVISHALPNSVPVKQSRPLPPPADTV